MKITTAILATLFLMGAASFSNAAIIVTSSFLAPVNNGASFTYTVRTIVTGDPTVNSASSYGFKVALTAVLQPGANISSFSGTAITIPLIEGSGLGFQGHFTAAAPINNTISATAFEAIFVGRQNSLFNFSDNFADKFRDLTFTITKPLSGTVTLTATPSAVSYTNANNGGNGGTGFVDLSVVPAQVTTTYTAPTVGNGGQTSFSITAVPEPSSLGLLAVAGVFGLGVRMRNWRSRGKSAC
jgi:hypothetical protein